ncbi:MAG: hypothetical protein IT530_16305 [Burkholderiales bacterium]|nr:hypothetical protein [Burkholderiales bacterium]
MRQRSPDSSMPSTPMVRRRACDIDIERCACGGEPKILAAIEDPVVIVRILTHLGLPARAPPRAPARAPALVHAA